MFVAGIGPVQPEQQADRQQVAGGEMHEPDSAHQEVIRRLAAHRRERIGDQVAGDGQGDDGQGVQAVP